MNYIKKCSRAEHGGALLVSIIMIFMMSILGVSTMRGSTIERRMADNSIITNKNFQIAESSTELSLNEINNLADAINGGQPLQVDTEVYKNTTAITSWAELTFVGRGFQEGTSFGDGNPGTFDSGRFVSRGNSESASVRASSEIHQGASHTIPGL